MNKQYKPFEAIAMNIREKMICYWMEDEGYENKKKALDIYGGVEFESLCKRIESKVCNYIPDLGYTNKEIEGSLCFEGKDNNFCIPIKFLTNIVE